MNPARETIQVYGVEVFTGILPVYRVYQRQLIELARVDTNVVVSRLSDGVILHRHIRDAYSNRGWGPGLGLPEDQSVDPSSPEGCTSRAELYPPIRLAANDGLRISNHCEAIDGVQTPIHVEVLIQGTRGEAVAPARQRRWIESLYGLPAQEAIRDLYLVLLNREPDPYGWDVWTTRLERARLENRQSTFLHQTVRDFVASPEFTSRT